MYVLTDDSYNYYITLDNEKIEFNNLNKIKDKENIKKIFYIYAESRYDFFDFSEFINIECLHFVLSSSFGNIHLGELNKLKYLLLSGYFSDPEEGYRMINKNIEIIDISGCPNLIYLYIMYFKNLKELKFKPLKKLCKFNIMIKNYDKLLINEYNKINIEENKKMVTEERKIINRRRVYLLAETPPKGAVEDGLYENKVDTRNGLSENGPSKENRICPKCGKYCNNSLLINIDNIDCFEQFFYNGNFTYTCC